MEAVLTTSGRQAVFAVFESGHIASARRAGVDLARRLGFDETAAGRVATVITEAATNIFKHAVRGEIVLRPIEQGPKPGIEVLAIDTGPGIAAADAGVRVGMHDGVPAAEPNGGGGLDAISRLSNRFDSYTAYELGTVLWMQLWNDPGYSPEPEWDVGVVCLAIASEEECGDAWCVVAGPDCVAVLLADGLGHGPEAAKASRLAIECLEESAGTCPAPSAVMNEAHLRLHGTRGAAVAVAEIDTGGKTLRFAGVGNISACIVDDAVKHIASHNGIVGSSMRRVQEFSYPWRPDSLLIMHSDGLGTRWDLARYPGLCARHPALVAAVLYRDFRRQNDDMTILVMRRNWQPGNTAH